MTYEIFCIQRVAWCHIFLLKNDFIKEKSMICRNNNHHLLKILFFEKIIFDEIPVAIDILLILIKLMKLIN